MSPETADCPPPLSIPHPLQFWLLALFGFSASLFALFVEFWGRCLQTGLILLCRRPALCWVSEPPKFSSYVQKTKTQLRKPPPAVAYASSPLAVAVLLVHQQPRPAPRSSLPLSSLEPGALHSGKGPQLYRLPKSAVSLRSKNGEKGTHLFHRGTGNRRLLTNKDYRTLGS